MNHDKVIEEETMSNLEIATNIMELIQGDEKQRQLGFDKFNQNLTKEFINFLMSRGLNYEDAKDVCQITTIKIFKKAKTLKDIKYSRTWMYQILRRSLFDFAKKRQKYQKIFEEFDDEKTIIESGGIKMSNMLIDEVNLDNEYYDRSDCVEKQMEKFSRENPERSHALRLQMEGFDIKFIADAIGRTPGATKEYLNQCRKKISPWVEKCLDIGAR
jgi:RNA polymerase sigma factor (sigma-70 family)|tara:strand:+ start:887 stop:1531 length:645 start_codon:yes stop_codon:yes gene_type:complete